MVMGGVEEKERRMSWCRKLNKKNEDLKGQCTYVIRREMEKKHVEMAFPLKLISIVW